jgi:hypothetical protein
MGVFALFSNPGGEKKAHGEKKKHVKTAENGVPASLRLLRDPLYIFIYILILFIFFFFFFIIIIISLTMKFHDPDPRFFKWFF